MPAKFDGVALIVTDMDRSLRFYRDLIGLETYSTENYPYYVEFYGFSLWTSPAAHEVVFGELHAGEPQQAWAQIRQFPVTDMAFDVDDVDGLFAKMKEAGEIEIVHEPRTEEWGQRTARFFDPDGHLVEISHWLTPREQPNKAESENSQA
jgi:catechol 2,3-dioxygenase-like lactoylglutathione lyase family enzyme